MGAPTPTRGERWFAWHPVRLERGGWRWLTTVERIWKDDLYWVGDASGYAFEEGGWVYQDPRRSNESY